MKTAHQVISEILLHDIDGEVEKPGVGATTILDALRAQGWEIVPARHTIDHSISYLAARGSAQAADSLETMRRIEQ